MVDGGVDFPVAGENRAASILGGLGGVFQWICPVTCHPCSPLASFVTVVPVSYIPAVRASGKARCRHRVSTSLQLFCTSNAAFLRINTQIPL